MTTTATAAKTRKKGQTEQNKKKSKEKKKKKEGCCSNTKKKNKGGSSNTTVTTVGPLQTESHPSTDLSYGNTKERKVTETKKPDEEGCEVSKGGEKRNTGNETGGACV